MKKTGIYLGVVLVLVLTYWLMSDTSSDTGITDESEFSIADTNSIGRIFLANKSGGRVDLQRKAQGWVLSDGQAARKDAMGVLLTTLARMTMFSPVPAKEVETQMKNLAAYGTKVEVYDRSDDLISVFYVGPGNRSKTASYMLKEGGKAPYLVHVPGFNGYLTPRFIAEPMEWGSRMLFNLKSNEIDRICLNYPTTKEQSFCIEIVNENLHLLNALGDTLPLDTTAMIGYLDRFAHVHYEAKLSGKQIEQTAFESPAYFELELVDQLGSTYAIEAYKKPNVSGETDLTGNQLLYDPDRFYGIVQNKDTVLLQYYVFDALTVTQQDLSSE